MVSCEYFLTVLNPQYIIKIVKKFDKNKKFGLKSTITHGLLTKNCYLPRGLLRNKKIQFLIKKLFFFANCHWQIVIFYYFRSGPRNKMNLLTFFNKIFITENYCNF